MKEPQPEQTVDNATPRESIGGAKQQSVGNASLSEKVDDAAQKVDDAAQSQQTIATATLQGSMGGGAQPQRLPDVSFEGRDDLFLDIDRMVNEGLGGGRVTLANGLIGDDGTDTFDDPESVQET